MPHARVAAAVTAWGLAAASLAAAQPAPIRDADEREAINARFVERLTASIAGREQQPAGRVFTNIRFELFEKIPAADLLDIMQGGYSRALGVTCTHCHLETDFASDAKPAKRVARQMAVMHRRINDMLTRIDGLDSEPEDRFINCGTCHRGTLHPQKRPPRAP